MTRNSNIAKRKIFIILCEDTREFYIWHTTQSQLRTLFKDHYRLRIKGSIELISKAKERNIVPSMYLLEEVEATIEATYSRCIAWAKVFIDDGFYNMNDSTFQAYISDLYPETISYYEKYKQINFYGLIDKNKSISNNYHPRKKTQSNKNLKRHPISFNLSSDENERIVALAEQSGLTKAAVCKQLIKNGKVIILDFSASLDMMQELREGLNGIQQTIYTIAKLQQYFPEDLRKIEEYKNTVEDLYSRILKERRRINRKIDRLNKRSDINDS